MKERQLSLGHENDYLANCVDDYNEQTALSVEADIIVHHIVTGYLCKVVAVQYERNKIDYRGTFI